MLRSTFSVVTRINNSGLSCFQVSVVTLQEHILATIAPKSARQHCDLDTNQILCGT